ncbi:MAG: DUF4102 domain-containing protein, partial [Proteobacteria bacterium]|nr:DUF4102 domain-containing protein [Pseudomonadota bacterium]
MPLAATEIPKIKPEAKPRKVTDGRGLYLLVNPNGSKLWRWKYQHAGKEKLLALGSYPDVSLSEARRDAEIARGKLRIGIDVSAERQEAKRAKIEAAAAVQEAVTGTFGNLAREWMAGQKVV